MIWLPPLLHAHAAKLSGCRDQLRKALSFTPLELPLDFEKIVAADGTGVTFAGELHLKHLLRACEEHHLGAHQIKFSHAAESFIVHFCNVRSIFVETFMPVAQGHCIVEP